MADQGFLAVGLVGASVLCHVTWNLLSKRASSAGSVFVGLWSALAAVLWAPVGIWLLVSAWPYLGWAEAVALGGALVLHTTYFLTLQRGYAEGELSLVYPVARGVAPLIASIAAVAVFHERPGLLGWLGIVVLSVSLAALGWPRRGQAAGQKQALLFALAVGFVIATYTLWDANSVAHLGLAPALIIWLTDSGRALILLPRMLSHRPAVAAAWRAHWREAIGTAVLAPLAYLLVLAALAMAPVTLVAPLREVGVVVAVVAGGWVLGEAEARRRVIAASGVVVGAAGVAGSAMS